ncbi:alpha/beta-hydrolase [Choiromyces venosus 120613-1]|uniref:Alpha/beta-hydrolase n=1 Tax=Choiromyces venosus 120613-1 TaxID=1336337 RepID=A0A3N4JIK0_9PEZI|nr:alpha/beta-hydrolase [Choiromyces venosus 120613-1]
MFTHKVIWGTLLALAELISIATSNPGRDPSPSGSQKSGGMDLESQWLDDVEEAVREAHTLEPLLRAPSVSGAESPVWVDYRLSASVIASVAPGKDPNSLFPKAKEEDVTEEQLAMIKKNAERAFLAYCPEKIIGQLATSKAAVTNENLGMKAADGKTTRKEFFIVPQNSVKVIKAHYPKMWAKSAFGVTGIGALVLVDEKTKEIVVSIRGTIGIMNWITDAAIIVVSARHLCENCWMHSGFWVATREVHKTVRAEVKKLWGMPQYKDYTLTVTGHSLGGAVAYLLRAQFAVDKDFCTGNRATIDLVTFGQPKAGDRNLAIWMEKLPGKYYRVTHADDLVVSLPASFGWMSFSTGYHYVHTRNEFHIKPYPDPNCVDIPVDNWKTQHIKKMVTVDQEWFYNGGAHKVGRYGLPLPTKLSPISSHSLYLYRTNICSTKLPKPKEPPSTLLTAAKSSSLDELLVELGIDPATAPSKGIMSGSQDEWDRIIVENKDPRGVGHMSDVD